MGKTKTLSVLRHKKGGESSYFEDFRVEVTSEFDTVLSALKRINSASIVANAKGEVTTPIAYESSCNQKKCGACAMVVNGRPSLGCASFLSKLPDNIRIEPLRKFKVVEDLIVDRSILFENLKTLNLWLEEEAKTKDKRRELNYRASECIQCGLCLEVCPNFVPNGSFFGMNSVVLSARLLTELSPEERKRIAKLYDIHCYRGCAKSLACKNVCPRHIKTDEMLVNANLLAIWKVK